MLRRLHTRIIGMGAVCGLNPSPPAEVFFKTLPPPRAIDPAKYQRFKAEEAAGVRGASRSRGGPGMGEGASEPFYDLVAGAAGHKHAVFITREGNLLTVGDNRYGQTGAPREQPGGGEEKRLSRAAAAADWAPLFIDLGDALRHGDGGAAPRRPSNHVACGANFTIVYQRGGRRAVAFGNNHVGQLGVCHKNRVGVAKGFEEWDAAAAWWPAAGRIHRIVCGYNHAVLQLEDGTLFAFGSNTWGELCIGGTTSPMGPARIEFFERRGLQVRKVACGNSFTVFLTTEGRVYGCGATNYGQLPPNAFEPVPIPLLRTYADRGSGSAGALRGDPAQPRLIRIRDVACAGSLVVFLSTRNEILVQGALPEFGVLVPSPRVAVVDQRAAIAALQASLRGGAPAPAPADTDEGFVVEELVSGPSAALVRYRNGCVAALGSNSEGQLHSNTTTMHGRKVALAPSFACASLLPMHTPVSVAPRAVWERAWFACGSGFSMLVDPDELYLADGTANPIELPPGVGELALAEARRHRLLGALR